MPVEGVDAKAVFSDLEYPDPYAEIISFDKESSSFISAVGIYF